jgi:hypothetical protein
MRKCEWRDGKFEQCKGALGLLNNILNGVKNEDFNFTAVCEEEGMLAMGNQAFAFCPFCGAKIIKPKPKVIIKRSGDTWVARFEGVDYLCVSVFEKEPPFKPKHPSHMYIWQPFHKIEITDEIAKLRPMVKHDNGNIEKLIYVDTENYSLWTFTNANCDSCVYHIKCLSLATVDDL